MNFKKILSRMAPGSRVATAEKAEQCITLRGSTAIVTEFFGYSINSILYQRGIYPPESFKRVSKYGLTMLVTEDEKLKTYLSSVLERITAWLMKGEVQKLVVVISGVKTDEVLERWVFNIEHDENTNSQQDADATVAIKPKKEITLEIQAIIRQITASVTFLPLLNEQCSFDLLIYTDKEAAIPIDWEESDPRFVSDSTQVRLRSFTTKVHKVDTMVSYKNPTDEV